MTNAAVIRIILGLFIAAAGIGLLFTAALSSFFFHEWATLNERALVRVPGGDASSSLSDSFLAHFLPSWSGFVLLVGGGAYALFRASQLIWQALSNLGRPQDDGNRRLAIEDRLDELERLKRRNMITPEEYAAKRADILKDL